jgi:acetoin utilization protein AcuC
MNVAVYIGEALGRYGYEEKPWFLPEVRLRAFQAALASRGLAERVQFREAGPAADADILRFHTPAHLARVRRLCAANEGALDHGPTLARASVEVAATHVVGAVMDAARRILAGEVSRAFVPIAGFHHAHADAARSYCLYNDAAIVLSLLREVVAGPVAYVDIDVHHGDGVYAAFAGDPRILIADIHEDGRTLFPHSPDAPGSGPVSGAVTDVGEGEARGTKLNIPLPAGATDAAFLEAFAKVETFLEAHRPAFVVLVSGVDGLAGDPMAHLALTPAAIAHATRRLAALADRHAQGRLLVLAGGGYALESFAAGQAAVVEALLGPREGQT